MKIPRFYSGKFNPKVDIPVNPHNKALTLQQFANLPLDTQRDVLAKGHQLGDPGVENPNIDFVPPMCRKGITLAELMKTYKEADERIKAGITNHKADKAIEESLRAAEAAAAASTATT